MPRWMPRATLFVVLWHTRVGAVVTPFEVMRCGAGAPPLTTECMTRDDYEAVRAKIGAVLSGLDATCHEAICPQAEWAGCVLRMAGHDFMDFDGFTFGGSDGCTDMSDPDNAGLAACLHAGEFGVSLKDVYQDFCQRISLADFIVLAAEAVMIRTREIQLQETPMRASVDFARYFRYGRTTAQTCPSAAGKLPNPENGCADVEKVFVKRMGLSWNLAAALMGVHTLGRARKENSGYDGWWMDPENSRRFNNQYYVAFVAAGWVPDRAVGGNPGKNQWMRSDKGRDGGGGTFFPDAPARARKLAPLQRHQMMLNTDMCLMYSNGREKDEVGEPVLAGRDACCAWVESENFLRAIQLNGGTYCGAPLGANAEGHEERERKLCCGDEHAQDCGNFEIGSGPAFASILEFANDEPAWLYAFQVAWTKATENGFPELHGLQATCPAGGGSESMPASAKLADEPALLGFLDKWATRGPRAYRLGARDVPVALAACVAATAAVLLGFATNRARALQRQGSAERAASRPLHNEAHAAQEEGAE